MSWRDAGVLAVIFAVVVSIAASAIHPHNREKP